MKCRVHKFFHRPTGGTWLLYAGMAALLCCPRLWAQVSHGGTPYSFTARVPSDVPSLAMPPVDVEAYLAEDALAGKDEPYRFGAPIEVDLNLENAGEWTELPNGDRLWRLRISSPGAYSLNLLYQPFYLPNGATLFLYTDDHADVLGAFTEENNFETDKFLTAPTPGDAVTLEYYEPAAVRGQGVLHIMRVVHAYRNLFGRARTLDEYGDSGWCNNNVNCPEGQPWQNEKRSVAMILHSGFRICTGSLVNNARNDFTPFFLTANHCLGGEQSWMFMFNYESPGCPNQNGPTNQTISNATLRAHNAASDFALLQLSSNVPLAYNPFFAGWTAIDTPSTNSVCIHHPSGDIKKISFDNHPPGHASWTGTPARSHWQIFAWDDGTTEPGSSGSPLYDQNHRVTGQLHGGQASCDNNVNDYYGKFSMSWSYGTTPGTRLRDWLDPDNTGILILDGIDPNASGMVRGTVRDQDNAPLDSVYVGVVGGGRSTETNAQGQYVLRLPDGDFEIEFRKFGYATVQEEVSVAQSDTVILDVTLPAVASGHFVGVVSTQFGRGLPGARWILRNTPLDTLVTDSLGRIALDLPGTLYSMHVEYQIRRNPVVTYVHDTTVVVNVGGITTIVIAFNIPYAEPTAADAYGYRAYDRFDRDLPAPYEWVELDPGMGAPGIEFEFSGNDSAVFFPAPFPVSVYGSVSETLTVNSNGWLLPGEHHTRGQTNTAIPSQGPNDPPGVIAAFWDDLRVGLGAQQFSWFDRAHGRWIFEFINQRLVSPSNRIHNWQVHWWDPAFVPTVSGDGEIVFVYGRMDYVTGCTVGIESPAQDVGVQVNYNTTLSNFCWPIEDGAALRLTTGRPVETGRVILNLMLHPPAVPADSVRIMMAGRLIRPDGSGQFRDDSIAACPASAVLLSPRYEAARVNRTVIEPGLQHTIPLEAWRLDPPREPGAMQRNGVVTLNWRVPQSVEERANPNVRYLVYRDGVPVSALLSDTMFVDAALPDTAHPSYYVTAHYRYGVSTPSDTLTIDIDLAAPETSASLPAEFAFAPGYPNPFNPSTTLRFTLPHEGVVSLRIFNTAGQEVAELVQRDLAAGSHSISWDASTLPTGMYLAVLEWQGHRHVQKLLLLK